MIQESKGEMIMLSTFYKRNYGRAGVLGILAVMMALTGFIPVPTKNFVLFYLQGFM